MSENKDREIMVSRTFHLDIDPYNKIMIDFDSEGVNISDCFSDDNISIQLSHEEFKALMEEYKEFNNVE